MNHLHDESTGGPAFPAMEVRTADTQDLVANASQGMTLRDWFAGQALAGITAREAEFGPSVAKYSYQYADAMLIERAKVKQPAIPTGYKLVPIEPTKTMIDAVSRLVYTDDFRLYKSDAIDLYKLMIGAFHASK